MKRAILARIDEELYNDLKKKIDEENRSVSNYIETLLKKEFKKEDKDVCNLQEKTIL